MLMVHTQALRDAAARATRATTLGMPLPAERSHTAEVMAQSACARLCDRLGEQIAATVDDSCRRIRLWADATSRSAERYETTDVRSAAMMHAATRSANPADDPSTIDTTRSPDSTSTIR